MPLLKNGFLEKIETWHVGLSCQYTHFMSYSSKSEHDTIADQATLRAKERMWVVLIGIFSVSSTCVCACIFYIKLLKPIL